ncbi:unnamed protein product [Cylicostephanus goldi]|uniref:Transcription initiation factor TFIID subunit 9 n=1 Tax=Cylicostephanus goldi TaxID=71465 RepID=A0A3P6SMX6_CYLGO|nr:unnamed protein product [Cylicostephanus goldi]
MDASRDISHVKAILEEAGITDYDPRVVHLLLDLLYTTTSGLLTEAKAISQHCGKMVIDETDVQIAVEMSGEYRRCSSVYCRCNVQYQVSASGIGFVVFLKKYFIIRVITTSTEHVNYDSGLLCDGKPNRADLLKMACERNAQPLPQIRHNFGLKLPNDRFCLLQPNVEWRGSDRTTADLLANNAPLTVGQPPAHGYGDDSLQQLRPEHVTNLLKRPAEEDFDA